MKSFLRNVYTPLIVAVTLCRSCYSTGDGAEDGACYFQGEVYRSGQKIPQEEACHVCLCYKGRVDCSWMDCPPPPDGCGEMTIPGECNPTLYICPIPKELTDVGTTWMRRFKRESDVKPGVLTGENENDAEAACKVMGVPYKTGDLMGVASHPCLECRCARNELYCSPRCCFTSLNAGEKPSSILKALSRGSRLPEKHPLDHLWKEQEMQWDK